MPQEFTKEQLDFLARYLKPIEDRIKKRKPFTSKSKREEHNTAVREEMAQLRDDYGAWIEKRDQVTAAFEAIEITYDLTKVPEQNDRLEELKTWQREIVERVRSAPENAPYFTDGKGEMAILLTQVNVLKARTKDAIEALPPPPVTGVFDKAIQDVMDMLEFKGHPSLSTKLVNTAIDDAAAEQKRQTAFIGHERVCAAAKATIEDLRDQATGGADLAAMEKEASAALNNLRSLRVPFLKDLAEAVSTGGLSRMATLATGGDAVASREIDRMDKMRDETGKIGTAVTKINEKINDLKDDLDEAEGFQEKRAILAEISAEKDRLADMEMRSMKMAAYEAATAGRLEKMDAAEVRRSQAQTLLDAIDPDSPTFDAQVAAWTTARESERKESDPDDAGLPDVPSNERAFIPDQIERNRAFFRASSQRILVDAKMYPSEADVTEISSAQHDTLQSMLTTAMNLYEKDKFNEAHEMYLAASQLHMTFIGSRNFALPEIPTDAMPMDKQVEKRLKAMSVELDKLWGLGGDDFNLRVTYVQLGRDADTASTEDPPDYRAVLTDLDKLERDVALALREAAQPTEEDKTAKAKAGEVANNCSKALLGMYRTEPLRESDIAGVHPNDLLVVTDSAGNKEYHRIKLRDDDTVQRREDKDIPRAAIDVLRQKMQMVEVIKDTEGAGLAGAINDASKEADDWRKSVMEGAPFYKRVEKALIAFDKSMKSSELKEWRLDGIEDLKAQKASFESSYAAAMLPEAAAIKAEDLASKADDKVTATGPLKTRYKAAKTVLDGIENALSAKPKGDDGAIGKMLATLLKKGADTVNTQSLDVQKTMAANALMRQIEEDLEKIKELGQHGTGVQGKLRTDLERLQKTLEMKSEQGIADVELKHPILTRDLAAQKQALSIKPSADPMAYLTQMAAFLGSVKTACVEKEEKKKAATEKKAEAKTAVGTLESTLNGLSNLSNKNEYKSIFQSIKSQYDTGSSAWNKGKGDPSAALSTFTTVLANAKELETDLKNLNTVYVGGQTVDINGWTKAISDNVAKVAAGAVAAGNLVDTRYKQDDPPEDATEKQRLEDAIAKVQATMALVNSLSGKVTFTTGLQAVVDKAIAESDPAEKRKQVAGTRELVLSEIRRMNGYLNEDPALAAYRDNPFDHGEHWPQLRATLLACEAEVLKSLNPGR